MRGDLDFGVPLLFRMLFLFEKGLCGCLSFEVEGDFGGRPELGYAKRFSEDFLSMLTEGSSFDLLIFPSVGLRLPLLLPNLPGPPTLPG